MSNYSVIFESDQFPNTFRGYPVESGENDDTRFTKPGVVYALRLKPPQGRPLPDLQKLRGLVQLAKKEAA